VWDLQSLTSDLLKGNLLSFSIIGIVFVFVIFAGTLERWGGRNRVGIGLPYWPARLQKAGGINFLTPKTCFLALYPVSGKEKSPEISRIIFITAYY
jgi:hypothetical protein